MYALLLRRFGVTGVAAVVLAASLPLMHPQVLRWSGHYALAYVVVLPWAWWCGIRWSDRPDWRRAGVWAGVLTGARPMSTSSAKSAWSLTTLAEPGSPYMPLPLAFQLPSRHWK